MDSYPPILDMNNVVFVDTIFLIYGKEVTQVQDSRHSVNIKSTVIFGEKILKNCFLAVFPLSGILKIIVIFVMN